MVEEFENVLHLLNYRWNLKALALWKGENLHGEDYQVYEGYDAVLSIDNLKRLDGIEDPFIRTRLRHALIDHYLQRVLLPHENEMRAWMKGAAAVVNGEKIYFREIIPWCQKSSTVDSRRILQKEAGCICKFLKPFALNYWRLLLETIRSELGFDGYLDYCRKKKGIDYPYYYHLLKRILKQTDTLYFSSMSRWVWERFEKPLSELSRYDAMNLLGFEQFDSLLAERRVEDTLSFFSSFWKLDILRTPGLCLDIGRETEKSAQAVCFVLQVPEEVYIVMRPEGGWIDLESLWHELGHGLSAVWTSPELSVVERDLATCFGLSEAFAFLIQNITLSEPFLEGYLHLPRHQSRKLHGYKVLRDLATFRRYATKFICEYEMFSRETLSDGRPYERLMTRYTGFYHQPETHLFDLSPEFYCLDYLLGWMAEAMLESFLRESFGPRWIFCKEAAGILKEWWAQGNRRDLPEFVRHNNLGNLSPELLLRRWTEKLT